MSTITSKQNYLGRDDYDTATYTTYCVDGREIGDHEEIYLMDGDEFDLADLDDYAILIGDEVLTATEDMKDSRGDIIKKGDSYYISQDTGDTLSMWSYVDYLEEEGVLTHCFGYELGDMM